jgi:hypothetical protein
MRPFRFSILQLLLAATLVALVLGLVTSAWRATQYQAIEQLSFSPSGNYLAARYSGGGMSVWRLDSGAPRLVAQASGKLGLLSFHFGSIHFIADDKLLETETSLGSGTGGIQIRALNPQTRQLTAGIRVNALNPWMGVQAATADRLLISDWSSNSVSSYSLETGCLERKWPLPSPPLGYMAIAASGKTLAVCDQGGQVSVIDIKSDQAPIPVAGFWPVAVSSDGRLVAAGSVQKPGMVHLYDLSSPGTPVELQFDLSVLRALAILPDGKRVVATDGAKVESYDLVKQERLPPVEMDGSTWPYITSCAVSPGGERLASHSGSEIAICDLASGKAQRIAAGGARLLEIALYTLAFAGWSVIWGVVAKRERLKRPRSAAAALPPALQPTSLRPVPAVIPAKLQLGWLAGTTVLAIAFTFIMEGVNGSSFFGAWELLRLILAALAPALALVLAFSGIAYLVKGPHFFTLRRLQQLTRDAGRVERIGRLTFWFAGRSHVAGNISRHVDAVLDNAETVFDRPVEFRRRRLIACLDRQCDQDAYFGRHVPLAAAIPSSWLDRVGLVCEEAAIRQLVLPQLALRSVLGLSIVCEQKQGYVAPWMAALLTQQITRDERRPAAVRTAIRSLKVLMARYPKWDPRDVFSRSARDRFQLLIGQEELPAWLEVRAEADLLLTLGEMLLGLDAPADLRQKTLGWLRTVAPKDDPLATFTRDVGLTLDALLEKWRAWLAARSGLPYDPLPPESRWLLRDVAVPVVANDELPIAFRQRMVRELGTFYVAGAPALMELLIHPKIELRREAALALELLSGESFGDDLTRWQAWWQSLDPFVRGDQDPLGRMVAAAAVERPAEATVLDSAPSCIAAAAPAAPPGELKICWGLMLVSGLNALLIPIALIFFVGPVIYPFVYYSLFVGIATIVSAVARETRRMGLVAKLQMMNAMACDPINFFAGSIEQMLLRRPHVQRYLLDVNSGRA